MRPYRPFKYPFAVEAASQQTKMSWHEAEIVLSRDVMDFKQLQKREQRFITQILKTFTQSDTAVAENYSRMLGMEEMKEENELRQMFLTFGAMEGVHQRAYDLLNSTLGMVDYDGYLEVPQMASKIEFIGGEEDFYDLVASSAVHEGVSLFSAFAMLISLQRSGRLMGTCKIVEFSIKDENLHVNSMIELWKQLPIKKEPKFEIAVQLEDALIDYVFEGDEEVLGLRKEDLKNWVRYLVDVRRKQMGLEVKYGVKNPLEWMDYIILAKSHQNFFEQKSADYIAGGLVGGWDD